MTLVTGNLIHILSQPSQVAEVRIAIQEDRPEGSGIALADKPKATYNRQTGEVSFDAIPGPAMLLLKWVGENTSKQFPMLIPENGPATLRQCLEAAGLATGWAQSALEHLAQEIAEGVARVGTAVQVGQWAQDARQAATEAQGHATSAGESATTAQGIATNLPATINADLDQKVPRGSRRGSVFRFRPQLQALLPLNGPSPMQPRQQ